jgi:phenylpropionate dioxygenase-like ring-hydroxylating dioxygenase large terminal subunit
VKGFPFTTYPTGWYQVGWSVDLAPGAKESMQVFGEETVLYRTHSGDARLVKAACPHLGAHLGFGWIEGDDIKCPFHGWKFDPDGVNVEIPFCGKTRPNVRLDHWPIQEKDGFILVWHDGLGRDPLWDWIALPEFEDRENYYEPERLNTGVHKFIPQQMFENGPDALHFPYVHGSGEPANITEWREDFPYLHYTAELKFGSDKSPTWLTPNGPAVATITSTATITMGIVRFRLEDVEMSQLVAVTPVDPEHCIAFSTTAAKRDPSSQTPNERAVGMMKYQHAQIKRDFRIWEHQVYIERPPFTGPEEKHFATFRRFTKDFYPDLPAPATAGLP